MQSKISNSKKEVSDCDFDCYDFLPFGVFVLKDDNFIYVNDAFSKITGYSSKELLRINLLKLLPEEESIRVKDIISSFFRIKKSKIFSPFELCLKTKDGKLIELCAWSKLIESEKSDIFFTTVVDRTKQKKKERRLNQLLDEQKILLDNIEVQTWFLIDVDTYGVVNQAHANFFGLNKELFENKLLVEIMSEDETRVSIESNIKVFEEKKQLKSEELITNLKGEECLLAVTRSPIVDEKGNVKSIVCSAIDITEQKIMEKTIYNLTYRDDLTGLYNRRFFNKELKRFTIEKVIPLSIIILDVNGLKSINDTYGHLEGDKLLKLVAKIVSKSCKKKDIISRWGGDEIIIIMPEASERDTDNIIKRIKERCDQAIFRQELPVSVALGAATKTNIAEDINDTIREAEENMYAHKLTIRNSSHYAIINSLMESLKTKGFEEAHVSNMRRVGYKFGEKLGFSLKKMNKIDTLITLHDIGKIKISDEILTKSDKLTEEEYKKIKEHPIVGYRLLKSIEHLEDLAQEVLYHHEKWDGTGYPQGLVGQDIPYLSRFIAVIDAYEVMSSGRPYKKAMIKEEIVSEFKKQSGKHFDPDITEKFIVFLRDSLD